MKPTRQAVTKQKSAEINARLGELCAIAAHAREIGATAATAGKITAQLNDEFGLHWVEHIYWVRARKAGYPWPGGTVRRLTPEEDEKMDRRLCELHAAGMPGADIIKTLNGEFKENWTRQFYYQRVQRRLGLSWPDTPKAGRHLCPVEYLPEAQRAACYEDPAYEARRKIADIVICRECFQILHDGGMDGKKGHLWTIHRKDLECDNPEEIRHRYRLRNPGAPLFTWQRMADQQHCDVIEYMAKEADLYVTPDVLAAADSDPEYENNHMPEYVICREMRCGFKSRAWLAKHLANEHDIHGTKNVKAWRRQHNWAPIIAPDSATEKAEKLRERNKNLRELARIGRQHASKPKTPPRGLPTGMVLEKTKPRITLAAYYRLKGKTPYAMALDLYPANADEMENSRRATHRLFRKHGLEIEAEKVRLGALSEVNLEAERERATQGIQREVEKKRARRLAA